MLSASRVSIERAFGLLVARWRFLAFHVYALDQRYYLGMLCFA